MCHADGSAPPAAQGAGSVAATTETVLTAADGNRLMAYAARAGEPGGAGIVVMPDVRGLHDFYRHLAERFAEVGVDAVAVDYFGRTAGVADRSDGFEFMPHVQRTTPEGIAADVAAAAAYLRSPEGGAVDSVFTVGFCFGGGWSWRQSADQPGLAGAIGFYGRLDPLADAVDRLRAPLLMLIAGADDYIPVSDSEKVGDEVERAGVEREFVVYEGAPHSFFDRSFAEHADACDDAWRRIRSFMAAHRGA